MWGYVSTELPIEAAEVRVAPSPELNVCLSGTQRAPPTPKAPPRRLRRHGAEPPRASGPHAATWSLPGKTSVSRAKLCAYSARDYSYIFRYLAHHHTFYLPATRTHCRTKLSEHCERCPKLHCVTQKVRHIFLTVPSALCCLTLERVLLDFGQGRRPVQSLSPVA